MLYTRSDVSAIRINTYRSSCSTLEGNNYTHQPDVKARCITVRVYGLLLRNITTVANTRFQFMVFRLTRAALHMSYT